MHAHTHTHTHPFLANGLLARCSLLWQVAAAATATIIIIIVVVVVHWRAQTAHTKFVTTHTHTHIYRLHPGTFDTQLRVSAGQRSLRQTLTTTVTCGPPSPPPPPPPRSDGRRHSSSTTPPHTLHSTTTASTPPPPPPPPTPTLNPGHRSSGVHSTARIASYNHTHTHTHTHTQASRLSLRLQQTLFGRVVLGSFWRVGHFLRHELWAVRANQDGVRGQWLEHLVWCVPVVVWLKAVCGMPLWLYVVAIVIPSNGLLLVRSFAEHKAHNGVGERTAIVENSWLLGPLYLFNNLHALHHKEPLLPWYRYNERYRVTRSELIAGNGGLVYSTYFDVARRFLFRPHDSSEHPTGGVARTRPR